MTAIDDLLGVRPAAVATGAGMGGHERAVDGETVEWYTPAWVFDALGLTFDLDPCSPPGGLPWIPAAEHYALPQDGLVLPWRGRVWCNPPYGPQTAQWLARMNQHRNGVALLFARTETKWFHEHAVEADAILFFKGRLTFVDATGKPPLVWDKRKKQMRRAGNAGAPSMLVAWGAECAAALRRMAQEGHGLFVEPDVPSGGLDDLL